MRHAPTSRRVLWVPSFQPSAPMQPRAHHCNPHARIFCEQRTQHTPLHTTHSVGVFALVGGSGEDFAEKREREVDGIPFEMPNVAT
jgi:hypothetical protein